MVVERTITTREIPGGYAFSRDDGQEFHMVWVPDTGHAVLYNGKPDRVRPIAGLVSFDLNVGDKLAAARRWVSTYPKHPAP
jgi:hypothetical protein